MSAEGLRIEALRELAEAEDLVNQARTRLHRASAMQRVAGSRRREIERIAMNLGQLRESLAIAWQREIEEVQGVIDFALAETLPSIADKLEDR